MDNKNDNLVDRLKSVKVDSYEQNPELPKFDSDEQQMKYRQQLPQDRFGAPLPFVFYKPEKMPIGKITVLDLFDIILSHRQDKRTVEEIAANHQLSEEDLKNLLKYVDVFMAVNKNEKEIPLFSKRDYDDEHDDVHEIESGFVGKKS
ncbi:NDUFAF4-like protein, partial [Euroglyphus maynei]